MCHRNTDTRWWFQNHLRSLDNMSLVGKWLLAVRGGHQEIVGVWEWLDSCVISTTIRDLDRIEQMSGWLVRGEGRRLSDPSGRVLDVFRTNSRLNVNLLNTVFKKKTHINALKFFADVGSDNTLKKEERAHPTPSVVSSVCRLIKWRVFSLIFFFFTLPPSAAVRLVASCSKRNSAGDEVLHLVNLCWSVVSTAAFTAFSYTVFTLHVCSVDSAVFKKLRSHFI